MCKDPGGDIFDPSEIVPDMRVTIPVGVVEYQGENYTQIRDVGGQPGNSGHIMRDIAFDEELDDSLFSLEAPEGFAVKAVQPPEITEKDGDFSPISTMRATSGKPFCS